MWLPGTSIAAVELFRRIPAFSGQKACEDLSVFAAQAY
jgi:hypothetical protein